MTDTATEPRFPHIDVQLTGNDGNQSHTVSDLT